VEKLMSIPARQIPEPVLDRVYYAVLAAAIRGEPCPTNTTLASGAHVSKTTADRAFVKLEQDGWFEVHRPHRRLRRVTVLGYRTARPSFHAPASSGGGLGLVGASEVEGSDRLRRAIARYHVNRGRDGYWQALAA
jgi:hypothetical protein